MNNIRYAEFQISFNTYDRETGLKINTDKINLLAVCSEYLEPVVLYFDGEAKLNPVLEMKSRIEQVRQAFVKSAALCVQHLCFQIECYIEYNSQRSGYMSIGSAINKPPRSIYNFEIWTNRRMLNIVIGRKSKIRRFLKWQV